MDQLEKAKWHGEKFRQDLNALGLFDEVDIHIETVIHATCFTKRPLTDAERWRVWGIEWDHINVEIKLIDPIQAE